MENKKDNFEEELNNLKSIEPEKRRSEFLSYCQRKIELEKEGILSLEETSNHICGVCSLFFQEIMPEFEEVMEIACDLEIPKDLRDRSAGDWERLKQIIEEKCNKE